MFKCGFVSIIGLPNTGKSSLANALVGEKVSIVSPKPQTTRNNIIGILTGEDYQIVFVDTPGLNSINSSLDKFMQKSAMGASEDVNLALVTLDATKDISKKEREVLSSLQKEHTPHAIVLTKCDLVPTDKIAGKILEIAKDYNCEVVPTSALKHKNLDELVSLIKKYLPQTQTKYYDDDTYTDRPVNFLVAEIVREKALFLLNNEVPHGIAVITQNFEEDENLCQIDVDIICEKMSHKAIIIGQNGSMLKKIGHNARVTIQKIVQKKVVLNIFVKVKPNWQNSMEILTSLGYDIKNL